MTWQRPSTDYGLGHDDVTVYARDLVRRADGGLVVVGWGTGLTAEHHQAFLLQLDSTYQPRCLSLLDYMKPGISGAPLLLDAATTDAGRTYVGGLTFSGQYRTLMSAWD